VVVTKPFSKVNITALVAPINVLQACTAGFCVAGRLPILQNLMSFLVGKGLILAGLAVMGISWDETRKNNNMESDKKKSLITTGLYSKVRHPFLAGQWLVLIGFAGSYWKQQSPMRYFLAGLYYLILRKKVEMEEEQLEQEYGHEYQVYKVLVKGQLIPMEISSIFDTASRTSTARAKKEKEV
jgi:protein-S-isoprenylcysteine O-methyltransferase Ste14